MSKINLEWVTDRNGNYCIQATKKRGNISITELQETMRNDYRLCEFAYAIIFPVKEESFDGWSYEDPAGDVLHIYQIGDDETCPICLKCLVVEYCPHCGEELQEESK